MNPTVDIDGNAGTGLEQLHMARRSTVENQCLIAKCYDWGQHPETVLGWIMAQKGIDLATALTVFINGDPMRYNYISKRDVPAAHRGICRLLDNIAQRVNSGFYLPDPSADMSLFRVDRLSAWMRYQQEDRQEGRVGRWVFDEKLVAKILEPEAPRSASADTRKTAAARGFIRGLVAPLRGLGLRA